MSAVDGPSQAAMEAPREQAAPRAFFAGKALFWVPIAPLVAADLWSKAAVFGWLDQRYPGMQERIRHEVWSGPVDFDLVRWHNTGTIWGLFQGHNLPLVILRCVAVVFIVFYVSRLPARARAAKLVLGVILAGALGNLYDNLTEPSGGVRDFLSFTFHFGSWSYEFPAFNIADSCISIGVVCLAIGILFDGRKR